MAAASSITSGEEDLWTLARELQAPTKPLRDFMNIYLGSLLSSVAAHLNRTQVVAGLNIEWRCEYFLGGSTGNNTAVRTNASNDLDTLVVLTPSLAGYDVVPILVGNKFSLQVSPKPPGRGQTLSIEIGDNALLRLWTAFRTGVEVFASHHRDFLAIKPVAAGSRLVDFTENTDWQMRCSLDIGRVPVDVLPAFQTLAEVHLVLRRKVTEGANIVKSFSVLASRRLESLPEKGRQLISAMKHAKIIHGSFKSPGCLFEAAVFEVFDRHGWIGEINDVDLLAIRFLDVWKECWTRIRSWDPIAAPGAALSDENLLDWIRPESKAKLLELATHYQDISEAALLAELGPAPGGSTAGPSQSPSGASTSTTTSAPAPTSTVSSQCQFSLSEWLALLTLSQYLPVFKANGFEDHNAQVLKSITDANLLAMDITMVAHRKKLLEAIASLPPTGTPRISFSFAAWLAPLKLSQYLDVFTANGFEDHDSQVLKSLTEADLMAMGITMLAHRKKLMTAIASLPTA